MKSTEKAQVAIPSQATPTGRDRRETSREEVDTSAVIYLVKIASRLRGRILDLSLNGCRIRTDERFPVGIYTRVETEFRIEGLPFRLAGVIQAIHDKHTVGIRFLDMSSRKREQVEQLIEEIREMKERKAGTSHPGDEDLSLHPSEQKSHVGDPGRD
jgi:c-di-GMP-binding flagellar brake protein YcgR